MKTTFLYIILIVIVVILALLGIFWFTQVARAPEDTINNSNNNTGQPQASAAVFGSSTTLEPGKLVIFNNELTVTLQQINDSRCKQGVVCVWAGELSAVLTVSAANMGEEQVQLGTTNNKKVVRGSYAFELQNATETSATILVTKTSAVTASCYVGGCSQELCSDQPNMVSACIWNEEFACYKTAKCERQSNGQCGWTQTAALNACLNSQSN